MNDAKYFKKLEFGERCKETQSGDHIYIDNICICGKVTDIIEEDEEEYDDEGKPCLKSKTGNHHFVGDSLNCKYCLLLKTQMTVMSIRKSIKKSNKADIELLNRDPLVLAERREALFKSQRTFRSMNSNDSILKLQRVGTFEDRNKDEDV